MAFRRRSAAGRAILVAPKLGGAAQEFGFAEEGRVLLSAHIDRGG